MSLARSPGALAEGRETPGTATLIRLDFRRRPPFSTAGFITSLKGKPRPHTVGAGPLTPSFGVSRPLRPGHIRGRGE